MQNYMKTADVVKWLETTDELFAPIFPKHIDLSQETITVDLARELCDQQYTPYYNKVWSFGENLFRKMESDVVTFVVLQRGLSV